MKINTMKKNFIITFSLLFIASAFSFAQVDSSDLMKSQRQLENQNKRLNRQQNKVQKMNRKLEKQQKRLNRQNRKLNKENRRSNKEMREMEREQKKLEDVKTDSTSGTSLYDRRKLTFSNRFNERSAFATYFLKQNHFILNHYRMNQPIWKLSNV